MLDTDALTNSGVGLVGFNIIQATITGYEGRDLLTILDKLDTDALTNSGVGLFGLNTNLLKDNSLGMTGTSERIGLPSGSKVGLFVIFISPSLGTSVILVLPCGTDSLRLTHFDGLSLNPAQQ